MARVRRRRVMGSQHFRRDARPAAGAGMWLRAEGLAVRDD